jgi:isoquinoline 1-oxidoreductase alpha subunit
MISLDVNGTKRTVDVEDEMPLLWVLRDELGITGPKYGCGVGECGCCTVHLDGAMVRSCVTPARAAAGKKVTTIEGIAADRSNPVLVAWIESAVPQCGYCQPGQIMAATALLKKKPHPSDADIDIQMRNICRCGTYAEIRAAVHRAAELLAKR